MKVAGGGFDQCYNAKAVVATGSLLIVAAAVTQAANDREQLMPMIGKLQALPKEFGRTRRILADSGYLSQSNVEQCAAAGIEPLIAWALSPSSQLKTAICRRTEIPAGIGHADAEDAASEAD